VFGSITDVVLKIKNPLIQRPFVFGKVNSKMILNTQTCDFTAIATCELLNISN